MIEQYLQLAKSLLDVCRSDDPTVLRGWAARWAETLVRLQSGETAREFRQRMDAESDRIENEWQNFRRKNESAARCSISLAQVFIARQHGFAAWPNFARHIEELERVHSRVSRFESAVDAIVFGSSATLEALLREDPDLAHARSGRDHRSTLLHYVSANSVENFRQRTPGNIVEIAELLLGAGAAVDAESEAYGGRSTTLGLTATSCHPENAGVQLPLMELLIAHGAALDGADGSSAVNSCLRNGRGEAARFLAARGARLDLEGAAGVGRLDLVRTFFSADGALRPPGTEQQRNDAFAWACQFGCSAVVDFLLQNGMSVDAKLRHHGQTGLHWAAYGGHAGTAKLLLDHGASIAVIDDQYEGTPLGWALYAWDTAARGSHRDRYYEVVAELVRAGAKPSSLPSKVASDGRMQAALRGERPAG